MKPGFGAAVALVAAVAVLAGCSRATNVQSGDAAQILHRGLNPEPSDLDPHLATQTSYYSVLSAILEGLVSEDPVDLHPVPAVAESWDISPDGLNYTFYLRASAKWSDGQPVTAQDFVDSWHRILTPSLGAFNASQLYVIQGAEAFNKGDSDFSQVGLRARDPRTLKVTLEHPAPWFLSLLSSPAWLPVPVAVLSKYGGMAERGNSWAVPERWVGNGPFLLKSWHHGQEIIVSKSATYWDASRVRLKEVHFHVFESIDAEERAFRSGQLHLTEAVPPDKIDVYRRDSPNLIRIDRLLGTYFLRINTRRPNLNDQRVRSALATSIDREAITEKVLRGGQAPALTFTPLGLDGYAPQAAQQRNIEAAVRLLADSGHPGGTGLADLELLYNSSENNKVIAEALQEMWRRDLGVQVRLVNEDLKSTEEARSTGSYELLRSSWIADYADPSAFLDVFRGDSGNNFTGWTNPDYDSLLFTAARTPDQAARNALYGKAEAILLREAPIIPIYHYMHVFLIRPSVHGWNPTVLDHHPYKDVFLAP